MTWLESLEKEIVRWKNLASFPFAITESSYLCQRAGKSGCRGCIQGKKKCVKLFSDFSFNLYNDIKKARKAAKSIVKDLMKLCEKVKNKNKGK